MADNCTPTRAAACNARSGVTAAALPLNCIRTQAACGGDAEAAAALRRGLQGLHTLLPDLQPHWQEQLGTYQVCGGVSGSQGDQP